MIILVKCGGGGGRLEVGGWLLYCWSFVVGGWLCTVIEQRE